MVTPGPRRSSTVTPGGPTRISACASCIWPALVGTADSAKSAAAAVVIANRVVLIGGSFFLVGLWSQRETGKNVPGGKLRGTGNKSHPSTTTTLGSNVPGSDICIATRMQP